MAQFSAWRWLAVGHQCFPKDTQVPWLPHTAQTPGFYTTCYRYGGLLAEAALLFWSLFVFPFQEALERDGRDYTYNQAKPASHKWEHQQVAKGQR